MTPLPKVTTVHEKTVQRAQELVEAAEARPRRSRAKANATRLPRWSAKPDPRAWKHALQLAKGDVSRLRLDPNHIDVTGSPSVVVRNPQEK